MSITTAILFLLLSPPLAAMCDGVDGVVIPTAHDVHRRRRVRDDDEAVAYKHAS
ncbi:uncharacterized protein G2W53_013411 [Senna tora]|uniref:Uncharacterized protein n=1 Tax=Senna tora TaxID=362788 RepID=A0A834WR88_9FABA|nr:uncharacterized protein G2W53_013411 [Senna tora]